MMEFRGRVLVRERASEVPLLLMAGLGSMAMVAGLAYALLGSSDQGLSTSDSIVFAGQMVIASLIATGVVLLWLLIRPRPYEANAIASPEGLVLETERTLRRLPIRRIRGLRVIIDGGEACVEFEKGTGSVRLFPSNQEEAEELAGALLGRERLPAAIVRIRRRSSYPLFITTISSWVLVYTSLCALPPAPLLGAILVAISLPVAVWITLRAIPMQLLVSAEGLSMVHPLSAERIPLAELAGAEVTDDSSVRVDLSTGERMEFHHLADHPLDARVTAANPPAVRLAAGIREIVAKNAGSLAA